MQAAFYEHTDTAHDVLQIEEIPTPVPGPEEVRVKELGLYVIKHTDGNLWPILDRIIDSGIDCLDPIDPQAGMDLGEVKAKYGQRVALKGNVDCAQLMTFGTPEEVVEATKEASL